MIFASFGKLPWDLAVFLAITTVGLGVSFKNLAYPDPVVSVASLQETDSSSGLIDLGCVDRKGKLQRLSIGSASLRVKGQLCEVSRKESFKIGGIRIRNLTSLEDGTVFLQGSHSKFVSNRIMLRPGKNTVQLEWNDPKTGKLRALNAELYEP